MEDSHFVGLFYFYFFVCMCVCGEKKIILFCGYTWPLLLLFGMAHTECNVRKFFGKRFCCLYLGR